MELMQVDGMERLQQACRQQVGTLIAQKELERQSHWSESIAIGSPEYVEEIKNNWGQKQKGEISCRRRVAAYCGKAQPLIKAIFGAKRAV